MTQTRPRVAVFSLVAVVAVSTLAAFGCSGGGGGGDDDDDVATSPTPACTALPNSNLSTLQTAIFTPQCALASCHDSVAPAGPGLDLSSAAMSLGMVGLVAQGQFNSAAINLVDSGSSGTSFLYLKVTNANGISGVAMPNTGQPLCSQKADAIKAWIDAGAPNN